MIAKKIQAHFHPERFQGWGKKRNYFEGWYFKLISKTGDRAMAIIPGIAMDGRGEGHAFIQVMDGKKGTAEYHTFPLDAFQPVSTHFEVAVGDNQFSATGIKLNLPDLQGEISISGKASWPNPWYAPGIMGPFSWLKFMECFHGIVSMDHLLDGQFKYQGEVFDFSGGRGYMEKDWGRSFPSAYVWMQSNHFDEKGISFKCSVAHIPFLGTSFTGFIAGLYIHGTFIRFTTYNRSRLTHLERGKQSVQLSLQSPKYRLEIEAISGRTTLLASPIQGAMEGKIAESMTATLNIKLTHRRSGQTIFEGSGQHAGLEIAGDFELLQ